MRQREDNKGYGAFLSGQKTCTASLQHDMLHSYFRYFEVMSQQKNKDFLNQERKECWGWIEEAFKISAA